MVRVYNMYMWLLTNYCVGGCVDNAVLHLSTCAERVAITKAVSEGFNLILAVAIASYVMRVCVYMCVTYCNNYVKTKVSRSTYLMVGEEPHYHFVL